jgi:hypothetical protein
MESTKYNQGIWLSLDITQSVLELALSLEDKTKSWHYTKKVESIIKEHYEKTKKAGSLDYYTERALVAALTFNLIPETFNMNSKNTKKYDIEDYLAGIELVLEQFQEVEKADKNRLKFLKDFVSNLGSRRYWWLEPKQPFL